MEWFFKQDPVIQALLATLFTWGMTGAGAALVFIFKVVNRNVMDMMLGFASGVMIAASFWSLLNPAIEMSENMGMISWLPPLVGFLAGAFFLYGVDRLIPHIHSLSKNSQPEGLKSSMQRSILLVFSITLHNIPEGLAVGVAFGAAAAGFPEATVMGAVALAIGMGIQNFPEGAAVSLPLRREGFSRRKSFMYGQFSGMVEPVAGVIGAAIVMIAMPILPYALAFAAGAMIYVVVEELIPESQQNKHNDLATLGAIGGFAVMMWLDVALG